jgi:hypothetical protein
MMCRSVQVLVIACLVGALGLWIWISLREDPGVRKASRNGVLSEEDGHMRQGPRVGLGDVAEEFGAETAGELATVVQGERRRLSTAEQLVARGLPLMPAGRREAIRIAGSTSLEEVAADLGNASMIELCRDQNVAGFNTFEFWGTALPPNLMVLRLIEEGRKDPNRVAAIVEAAIRRDIERLPESEFDGYITRGASTEFAIVAGFYVLANIDRLSDPILLARWIKMKKPPRTGSRPLDTWFIDYYFRCGPGAGSPEATEHFALLEGRTLVGPKQVMSRWDQAWERGDPVLVMSGVDPRDFETIEVLSIPRNYPYGHLREVMLIYRNFWQHLDRRRASESP